MAEWHPQQRQEIWCLGSGGDVKESPEGRVKEYHWVLKKRGLIHRRLLDLGDDNRTEAGVMKRIELHEELKYKAVQADLY